MPLQPQAGTGLYLGLGDNDLSTLRTLLHFLDPMTSCVNEVSKAGKIPEISPLTCTGKAVFSFQAGGNSREPLDVEESGLFLAQNTEKQEKVLVFKDLQP